MNDKRSEVKKVHQKDAKKPSEDKDGVTEGDYDADDPEDEEVTAADGVPDDEKRKKGSSPGSRKNGSREATLLGCQVEKCGADLSDAKKYHRRHKVCEVHAKAPIVIIAGIRQRFCQQCSFMRWASSTNRRGAAEDAWRGTTSAAGRVVPATTTEKTRAAVGRGLTRRRKVNAGNQTKEAESRLSYLGIKLIKQLDDSRYEPSPSLNLLPLFCHILSA